MNILSIGNSFSEDAQRYLKKIADKNGENLKCVNLFIGGCTLKTHYFNAVDNERAYLYCYNGDNTNIKVSIKDALKSDEWDYVTLQQGSHQSFNKKSYEPYIFELKKYVKTYAPHCKILLHQTWAYPDNRESLPAFGFKTTEEMFLNVKQAYDYAAKIIEPDGIIPSGEAMLKAYQTDKEIVYRDNIHASRGFGRYLLGLVWFKRLFGNKENVIHIDEFDVLVSETEKQLANTIAFEVNKSIY